MKKKIIIPIIVLALVSAGIYIFRLDNSPKTNVNESQSVVEEQPIIKNECEDIVEKTILISVEQRHLWACQGSENLHDSAIITGDMNDSSTLTPEGTYEIYAQETNRYLAGSDDKGEWSVHVSYWMPFLDNKYGTYGIHDATWQNEENFGNVDPYSSEASHGCVETPLDTAKWIYNWGGPGTTVVVKE